MTFEELVIKLHQELPGRSTTEVKYVGDATVLETTLVTKDVMRAVMTKLCTLPPTDVKVVLETAGDVHRDYPELLAYGITHSSDLVRAVSCDLAGYYATRLWMCELLYIVKARVSSRREFVKRAADIIGVRAGSSYLSMVVDDIASGAIEDIDSLLSADGVDYMPILIWMIRLGRNGIYVTTLAAKYCNGDELVALATTASADGRNKLAKKLRGAELRNRLDILNNPATPTRSGTIEVVYGESAAVTKYMRKWLQLIENQGENDGK